MKPNWNRLQNAGSEILEFIVDSRCERVVYPYGPSTWVQHNTRHSLIVVGLEFALLEVICELGNGDEVRFRILGVDFHA